MNVFCISCSNSPQYDLFPGRHFEKLSTNRFHQRDRGDGDIFLNVSTLCQSFLIAVPECMILTSHLPRSPCVFSSVSLDAVHPSAAYWLLERRLCGSLSTVFQGGEWDSDPSLDEPGPPGSTNSCFQAKILHIFLDLSAPL